jgi:hypothetical protein
MTAHQVYEQSVKSLSVPEKLTLARLIIDEVVPQSQPETPNQARQPRQFGAGRHLLSGAGIDVDDLMATPIEDMFAEYMPEEH